MVGGAAFILKWEQCTARTALLTDAMSSLVVSITFDLLRNLS